MITNIKLYLLSILCFVCIDAVWLGVISPSFYQQHIGELMREQFLLAPAIAFYLIFLLGLQFFVVLPNITHSLKRCAGHGAMFGLVTYATFDLTSHAVLEGFPLIVVVVDLLWGSVLSMSVSTANLWLARKMGIIE